MADQLELIAKPKRPQVKRMHVADAGCIDGVGRCAVFECSRCGEKTDWTPITTVTEAKRGLPCPVCNKDEANDG